MKALSTSLVIACMTVALSLVFSIYMSVFCWAYTLGTVFALLSDRNLRQAIATQRFVREVRRLREPFYLVCGYGETGRLICHALDRMGLRSVVLEIDEAKVGEIDLHSFAADVPALCADASNPELLGYAGLTHPNCAGVIALTNNDATNLAIAIAARCWRLPCRPPWARRPAPSPNPPTPRCKRPPLRRSSRCSTR